MFDTLCSMINHRSADDINDASLVSLLKLTATAFKHNKDLRAIIIRKIVKAASPMVLFGTSNGKLLALDIVNHVHANTIGGTKPSYKYIFVAMCVEPSLLHFATTYSLMKRMCRPGNLVSTLISETQEVIVSSESCCICFDRTVDTVLSCQHRFCTRCIQSFIDSCLFDERVKCSDTKYPTCPLCRTNLTRIEVLQGGLRDIAD
jgi:hypothetical protein